MTRRPLEVLALALVDCAIGGVLLWAALQHGRHRDVLVHFFAYLAVIGLFKGRDAARRIPALVSAARADTGNSRLGLVDEYRLYVYPVATGTGSSIFASIEGLQPLRLASSRAFPSSGALELVYEPIRGPR